MNSLFRLLIPFSTASAGVVYILTSLAILGWALYRSARGSTSRQGRLHVSFLSAVILFVWFIFGTYLADRSEDVPLLSQALIFLLMVTIFIMSGVIIASIGTYFGFTYLSRSFTAEAAAHIKPQEIAAKVLHSDEFLSVLRTALPKGNDDPEYGLDYIPFMLYGLDERRKRFQHSSIAFLRLTLFLGLFSAVIVAFFGYVVVVETAAGAPLYLEQIREEARTLSTSVQSLTPSAESQEFQPIIPLLVQASELAQGKSKFLISQILDRHVSDLTRVEAMLDTASRDTSVRNRKLYEALLDSAVYQTGDLLHVHEQERARSAAALARLDLLVPRAETALDKNESRIPELVKRLAVGLIVTTFLLALLRFTAGLYSSHYKEMLHAEYQDLALRRFYVAFKSSAGDSDQRKAVLATFVAAASPPATEMNGQSKPDELEASVVRELIAGLTKILNR